MVGIIGAGITGLVAAWILKQNGVPFRLYEASDQAGGAIQTLKTGPYRLEHGPHTLQLNDEIFPLLESLELDSQLIAPRPYAAKRFILRDGRYQALPRGPKDLLFNPALSPHAKWRVLREASVKSRIQTGESVDAFFRRRLGNEIADYLVAPFVGGIYAGNTTELDMQAAFPQVVKWEEEHGSLIKGMVRARKGKVHTGAYSFYEGMGTLTKTLSRRLRFHLRYQHRLMEIRPRKAGFELTFNRRKVFVHQVLLCCPAYHLSAILKPSFPEVGDRASDIPYAPVSLVHTAYPKAGVAHPLDGFGALHNPLEQTETLGTLFVSSLFPGRCPREEVLLSTFVGGARWPDKAMQDDESLKKAVQVDHRRFLGVSGEPTFQHIVRWPQGIPQYTSETAQAQTEIERRLPKGMYVGGNWIGGISVPASIQRGQDLAQQIISDQAK